MLAALAGLDTLDSARTSSYVSVLLDSLSAGLRDALEASIMEIPEPKSSVSPEFVQRAMLWARLRRIEDETKAARIEGREEGRHEGELHARREVLGRLLARAGLQPTASEQAQITACEDTAALDRWIEQVLGAQDVAQVLA